MGMKRRTREEAMILVSSVVAEEDGCKLWPWSINGSGYAQISIDGLTHKISRLVLEKKLGRKIQATMLACHTCDNRRCIAEEHLYEGSYRQNRQDTVDRGRTNPSKGSERWNSRLHERHIPLIRRLSLMGYSNAFLARYLDVSAETIRAVVNGVAWRHVSSVPRSCE